ncbi:hypothetical protein COY27_00500 [Candidatus Woesearchaeota archaeon CG_4_10_14_0_2_um_filter_33_13]|nr:MAG: hypothetical protein COY27_00500 [Candidatus Woesearchaeota archaeon CG_4_10_14_0_2_um_filter_33_13]
MELKLIFRGNKMEKTGIGFMRDLFSATRNHRQFQPVVIPQELETYVEALYQAYKQPTNLIDPSGQLVPTSKEKSESAVFTFSGGKDSLATFLMNQKHFPSFDCFYVTGITPYVKDEEYKRAIALAESLGIELKSVDLGMSNDTTLVESVIKNQMIYALVMETIGYTPAGIGFGGTLELGPQSMCFFHDSNEAFSLFQHFASVAWGEHELMPYSKDEIEAYRIIVEENPELVKMLSSCMAPADHKSRIRADIEEKFDIQLENKYQCGACYKCAEEQLVLSTFHGRSIPERYARFCKAVLVDKSVFEEHNLNGLVPHHYLRKLGISSVVELIQ